MKCAVILLCLQLTLSYVYSISEMPDELSDDWYDGAANRRMYLKDAKELNSERDDPESDESYWNEEDENGNDMESDGDSSSSTIISNSNGVNSYSYSSSSSNGQTIVNGIDTSKLPPNYHKVKTVTKIINGLPVSVNVTIDKKTDPVTGEVSVSVIESSSSSNFHPKVCTTSTQCKTGYYCRLSWVNSCHKCRSINQRCTEDAECCGNGTKGSRCVYGTCKVGYRKGDAGTLCKKTSDCKPSMCCARHFMKRRGICKSLAKQGEKCSKSESTMSEILHPATCPCVKGFVCSSGSWTERFFGGSMNTLLGGNTCRIPQRKKLRSSWWKRRDSIYDLYDDLGDDFEF